MTIARTSRIIRIIRPIALTAATALTALGCSACGPGGTSPSAPVGGGASATSATSATSPAAAPSADPQALIGSVTLTGEQTAVCPAGTDDDVDGATSAAASSTTPSGLGTGQTTAPFGDGLLDPQLMPGGLLVGHCGGSNEGGDQVVGLNAVSGAVIWRQDLGALPNDGNDSNDSVAYGTRHVFVDIVSLPDDGNLTEEVYAFDARTGALDWHSPLGGFLPATEHSTISFAQPVESGGGTSGLPPEVEFEGENVARAVQVFNADTGAELWHHTDDDYLDATFPRSAPYVGNGIFLDTDSDSTPGQVLAVAYSGQTLKKLWSVPIPTGTQQKLDPWVLDGHLLWQEGQAGVIEIDIVPGTLVQGRVWPKAWLAHPVVANHEDALAIDGGNLVLAPLSALTTPIWSVPVGPDASPVAITADTAVVQPQADSSLEQGNDTELLDATTAGKGKPRAATGTHYDIEAQSQVVDGLVLIADNAVLELSPPSQLT